jgi:hypothetical protein
MDGQLVTTPEEPATTRPLAESLMGKYPQVVSVINNIMSRKAGVAIGETQSAPLQVLMIYRIRSADLILCFTEHNSRKSY